MQTCGLIEQTLMGCVVVYDEANTCMLTHLANELNSRRTLFEKVGKGNIDFYYEKWRKIKDDIANELALRATANSSINTYSLQSVLSAIQTLITQRQPLLIRDFVIRYLQDA